MAASGPACEAATAGRRPGRWGRRVLLLLLLPAWVLLTWRALEPPVPIRLPPYEPEGMVRVDGGRIPPSSIGFAGRGENFCDRHLFLVSHEVACAG